MTPNGSIQKIYTERAPGLFDGIPQIIPEEEQERLASEAKNIPKALKFGQMRDYNHYLQSVSLIYQSSQEIAHRDAILETALYPKLTTCQNMLDVGIGDGKLSHKVASYCAAYAAVDISSVAFDSLDIKGPITKIEGAIENEDTWNALPRVFFDLILFGHLFYYLAPEDQIKVVDKAYSRLTNNGKIVIIFDEGGHRGKIIEHFKGRNVNFGPLVEHITTKYNAEIFLSEETIVAKNLETALHILGVLLNDGGTSAGEMELTKYLGNYYDHQSALYKIEETQKIIIIGQDGVIF